MSFMSNVTFAPVAKCWIEGKIQLQDSYNILANNYFSPNSPGDHIINTLCRTNQAVVFFYNFQENCGNLMLLEITYFRVLLNMRHVTIQSAQKAAQHT